MSAERGTQRLVGKLVEDLAPVRPIPRLRLVLAGVLAVWGLVAGAGVAWLGLRPDFVAMLLAMRGAGAVFCGLGLAGLGGVVAGLALGVPGREALARGGLVAGFAGLAGSAGVATLLVASHPIAQSGGVAAEDLHCLGLAALVGLLPALGVVGFAGQAAPLRPLALVLAAAAGTSALGAVAAQASCPLAEPRHLLVAHALAPAVGAVLLALPLLLALRRLARS